jgi:DNA-directed RNA polymerase subunit H (RpoH/RPB5)
MSSISSNRILSIYNSRVNVLALLERGGFNVDEYNGFSINEIDAMTANAQLDMLLTNPTTNHKAYVKYYFTEKQSSRQIRPPMLAEIVDELYYVESVLEKPDTLIIIIDDEPNDSIKEKIRYLFDHDGIFVILHNMKRLQFNLLEHSLVPEVSVLTEPERLALYTKYNIQHNTQLPEIDRFDPMALALGLRPGQVCKITRTSQTALENYYYRICV